MKITNVETFFVNLRIENISFVYVHYKQVKSSIRGIKNL